MDIIARFCEDRRMLPVTFDNNAALVVFGIFYHWQTEGWLHR